MSNSRNRPSHDRAHFARVFKNFPSLIDYADSQSYGDVRTAFIGTDRMEFIAAEFGLTDEKEIMILALALENVACRYATAKAFDEGHNTFAKLRDKLISLEQELRAATALLRDPEVRQSLDHAAIYDSLGETEVRPGPRRSRRPAGFPRNAGAKLAEDLERAARWAGLTTDDECFGMRWIRDEHPKYRAVPTLVWEAAGIYAQLAGKLPGLGETGPFQRFVFHVYETIDPRLARERKNLPETVRTALQELCACAGCEYQLRRRSRGRHQKKKS